MIIRRFRLLMVVLALALLPAWLAAAAAPVLTLTVEGAIGPASADYIVRGLANAARDGAQLVVLKMDTPGGLDSSMRVIIKAILNSPVPVAAYVAPSGARAASAGTYILYASHVAAMAPGTNLGAATPVQIGGPPEPAQKDGPDRSGPGKSPAMTEKQINDSAAYIRGLAQLRGRNADWAELAVRQAVSLSASEALKLNVIDRVAPDLPALLKQLEGRKVIAMGKEQQLQTGKATVVDYPPDWRVRFLAVITDPSVALLLMVVGIYGLIFEFANPGFVLPGVLGAICLLVGLYALQLLPVNYAGVALIFLGLGFMVAEAFMPSFGLLGVGGIAAFITGAVILIDTEVPGFGIPVGLIATLALLSALLVGGLVSLALRARRRPVVTGAEQLLDSTGEIVAPDDNRPTEGWARIHGENWRVVSNAPLRRGQAVRVLARDGLTLQVAPLQTQQTGEQA